MRFNQLLTTVYGCYRDNFWLFWRIMLPVAVVAILLDISGHYRSISLINEHLDVSRDMESNNQDSDSQVLSPSVFEDSVAGNLNTFNGIFATRHFTQEYDIPKGAHFHFLPLPTIITYNSDEVLWSWSLNFRIYYDYTPLVLMLLTLCPLSLAVASKSSDIENEDIKTLATSFTALETWKRTGKKAIKLVIAFVVFLLIVDIGNYIYVALDLFVPTLGNNWLLILLHIPYIYLLVTLSLYNPCLILEDNTLIGIFRRSHNLVSGSRIQFLLTYLGTGWFAAVFTSVMFGCFLFFLSFIFVELSPIRSAITPLRFLTLFVGGNVNVFLSELPNMLPTILICVFRGLIATFLIPIWAIITTYLYLEKSQDVTTLVGQTS